MADFYGFSLELVTLLGAMNVLYAAPGLCLGALRKRPVWLLTFLIVANAAWAVTCLVIAGAVWSSARGFGLAQLLVEAVFVGGLAVVEARHRAEILGG